MAELKIYKHVRAQATIKIKVGGEEQRIKFRGGRVFSNADEETLEVIGSTYHTTNEQEQKAIESRKDFGRMIYVEYKINKGELPLPKDEEYTVYPGVDTLNAVKNTLKASYPDMISSTDVRSPGDMLKFCTKVGAAFPDFFKEHEKFKSSESEPEEEEVIYDEENTEKFDEFLNGEPQEPEVEVKTPPEEEEPEEDSIEIDREELLKMKRGALDQFAADLGIESPETYPNKGAVIEAIEKLAE